MDDTQTIILQRVSGLMEFVEENYGEEAKVRMSLVALEVDAGSDRLHYLMAWGDDRMWVQKAFIDELYEHVDAQLDDAHRNATTDDDD